jgi:hypothetical protein
MQKTILSALEKHGPLEGHLLINDFCHSHAPDFGDYGIKKQGKLRRDFTRKFEDSIHDLESRGRIEMHPQGDLEWQQGHPEFRPALSAIWELSMS